jgi:membrane-associated PAP2 superfamily phosphatase
MALGGSDVLLGTTKTQLGHVWAPGLAFAAIAALFALTDLDRTVARAWAFDPGLGLFPARGAWWATRLLHDGGRDFIAGIWIATVAAYVASFGSVGWRPYRRPALFAAVAIALATFAVNLLKALSNVDCPWDLADFGGSLPYVPLLAHRPDALPSAACFPGAHSSAGFALAAFYFAAKDRAPVIAWVALWLALAVGATFAFGQEARGAHFLSHDLWSAFIVWFVELGVYHGIFGGRLWSRAIPEAPRASSIRVARADRVV